MFRYLSTATATATATLLLLLSSCSTDLAAAPTAQAGTKLDIAARNHAPGHPKEGWCGETAIQEALLYYGAFVPQRQINKAGKPRMPDLYASDIPVAMKALGLRYRWWRNRGDVNAFVRWIQSQVRAGKPVLVGVKINPTEHPEWGLDHFVLVVGYDRRGLVLNTTWGRAEHRSYAALRSKRKGLGFLNGSKRYYGLAIDGIKGRHKTAIPIQIRAKQESRLRLDAELTATGLRPGRTYQLRRYRAGSRKPHIVARFTPTSSRHTLQVAVDKRRATFFAITPR